jgi:predicted PurR-regulated permease PerM
MNGGNRVEQIAATALLLLLLIGCLAVLRPFLSAILWALILSFATWPVYAWIERMLGGRKGLAALTTTLLVALIVLMPLVIAGSSLADEFGQAIAWVRTAMNEGPPDPPAWIASIPVAGGYLYRYWAGVAHNSSQLLSEFGKYLLPASEWLFSGLKTLGQGTLQLALSLFIAYFFYRDGSDAAKRLNSMAVRLWGDRALRLIEVAAATMKGVIYGIIGTGIVQAILTGFGLWLAGVPGAFLLGFATFFLSLVPVGPPLVWVPASLWLFYSGSTGWGIFLLLWGALAVGSADNIIKPYFISRGSDLPFILVFLGALGGVISFGFLGIFLGPTLLAVGFNVIRDWTRVDNALKESL